MRASVPKRRHLVLVGGGHSHVVVVKSLGMQPEPGLEVTLVAKELDAPYSGMLPGLVAGHYTFEQCHIDLVRLSAWAGVRLVHGVATGIDRAARAISIEGRPPLSYDLASIDVGITPLLDGIAGAAEHALAVKPVSTFAPRWQALEERALRPGGPRRFVVIGSGAAGFEIMLAAAHRLRTRASASGLRADDFSFAIIGGTGGVLPTHNALARRLAYQALSRERIAVIEDDVVIALEPKSVRLASGREVACDAALLTTRAAPAQWFKASRLPTDEAGFLAVRDTLQLLDDDDVFAVGDCAHVLAHPREKAGVFAVRQGPPLTQNIRARHRGEPAQPFRPQKRFLTLLSTGGRHAIAARGPLALSGGWAWRWKDNIDRDFMSKFNDLVPMMSAHAAAMGEEPPCGGCAAKVGPDVLARALDRLQRLDAHTADATVPRAPRDDAAVIDTGGPTLRLETIDFFRALWSEPYVMGEIAACHATSDIFAMGGQPRHALANVVLPDAAPTRMEDDLVQLLAGARAALARDGVQLVGGHSGTGPELALGFAVSGEVAREGVLRKGGLRPGDRLILTKPIGTGILFAALMRARAGARDIAAALAQMRRSNAVAAATLARFGPRAMTDVTGFGLVGHLLEMLDASGCGARLDLARVPLLAGALPLAREGISSSLHPHNMSAAGRIAGPLDDATLTLLLDPQTSGGLLAGVPADRAADALAALHQTGEAGAAIVGEVISSPPDRSGAVQVVGRLER